MTETFRTVTVTKVAKWDQFAGVDRTQWRIDFADGRRKFTRTRREAVEWCAEMGYEVVTR